MAASFPNFPWTQEDFEERKVSLFAEAEEEDQRLGKITVMGKNWNLIWWSVEPNYIQG